MSRECVKCKAQIPNKVVVNDKEYRLDRRKFCLTCSPLFSKNHYNIRKEIEPLPTEKDCPICHKSFNYTKNNICSSCRNFYQRHKAKIKAIEYLGGYCTSCGIADADVLSFHHKDAEQKSFTIAGSLHSIDWKIIQNELDKCELLCHNCHMKLHKAEYSLRKQKILDYYSNTLDIIKSSDIL